MSSHNLCVQPFRRYIAISPNAVSSIVTSKCPQHHLRSVSSITQATDSRSKQDRINGGSAVVRRSPLPPHSLLPTKMLLRSLLVSTVSSSPFLLRRALKFLELLTKKPFALLDVSKNPVLYALLKKTFYEHFCAGENRHEVTSTIRNIKEIGFKGVILTYAREVVVDERTKQERGVGAQAVAQQDRGEKVESQEGYADIEAWRSGVLETLGMVNEGDFLALKFTGAGSAVTRSLRSDQLLPGPMQEALEAICTGALQRKVRILVDAEQQSVQPAIDRIALELMSKYNRDVEKAVVYNTYQMYLKSTVGNLNEHMKQAAQKGYTLGVKIVRGAYMNSEPRKLIHDTKEDTDRAYDESVKSLLEARYVNLDETTQQTNASETSPPVNLFLATHNKKSALSAVQIYQDRQSRGLKTVNKIEYGQLLGMADEVSCGLLQMQSENVSESSKPVASPAVYKCLSWGTLEDCLSYLLRRAVENKDAVSRTRSEAIATRKEIWRRIMSSVGLAR